MRKWFFRDQLKEVPVKLSNYLEKKHYLHATQLLVSALSMGDGVLEGVEALREVRTELETKKQKLSSKLLDELNKHLYKEQPRDTGLRRQGSNRDFQRGNETRNSKGSKVKRNLLDVTMPAYMSGQVSRYADYYILEKMLYVLPIKMNNFIVEKPVVWAWKIWIISWRMKAIWILKKIPNTFWLLLSSAWLYWIKFQKL